MVITNKIHLKNKQNAMANVVLYFPNLNSSAIPLDMS